MFICGWCGNPTEANPCTTCGRDALEFWDHLRRDLQATPAAASSTPGVHPDLAAHETLGLAATDDLVAYALDADLANVVLTDDARLSDSRTPTTHSHSESDVTSLTADLAGKSATGHTHSYAATSHAHAEADVTSLVSDLSGKALAAHAHDAAYAAIDHSHSSTQPYGIGDIYITTVSHADAAAVASHHGYGTWARFGAGRFLLLTDTAAEAQAGSATHSHSFTQPDAHAALSHAGATVADHAAQAHSAHAGATVANHTDVTNHVHVQTVNSTATGGTSGYTADTSTNNGVASGYSTANPTSIGVAAMVHTVGQANAHSDHAALTHSVGQASDHASQSHANGAVASGATDPLSITAFAWKRTA